MLSFIQGRRATQRLAAASFQTLGRVCRFSTEPQEIDETKVRRKNLRMKRRANRRNEKQLINTLKPHVFTDLSRTQFKVVHSDNDFRKQWATAHDVEEHFLRVFDRARENGLNPLDIEKRVLKDAVVKSIMQQLSGVSPSGNEIDAAAPQSMRGQRQREQLDLNIVHRSYLSSQSPDMKSLLEEQIRLEDRALDDSVERYGKLSMELTNLGRASQLKPAQRVLLEWYNPLTEALAAEQRAISKRVSSRKKVGKYIMDLPAPQLSVLVMHEVLAMLLNVSQGVKFVRAAKQVAEAVEHESNLALLRANKEEWNRMLKSRKKLTVHNIAREAEKNAGAQGRIGKWDDVIKVQVGSFLISKLLSVAKLPNSGGFGPFTGRFGAHLQADSTMHVVDAFKHEHRQEGTKTPGYLACHERVFQLIQIGYDFSEVRGTRFMPMLVPPVPWTAHDQGGYYSWPSSVMRTKFSRRQVDALRDADLSTVYKALNYMGDIPWKVHDGVLKVMLKAWDAGGGIASLPARKNVPLPPWMDKPTHTTDKAAWREWFKWERDYKAAKKENTELHSLRCDMQYKLDVAKEMKGRPIYFPFSLDFRGRTYPIPPHLNHIGADPSRSLLVFDAGVPLGVNGYRWIKIQLASVFGQDKLPFDERVAWTEAHMEQILSSARDPMGEQAEETEDVPWWQTAENPWQCLGACFEVNEVEEWIAQGKASADFVSKLPIHQDGSCNGLQHYAALGRDASGGAAVNLTPSDRPQDVYTGVLKIVLQKLDADAAAEHEIAPLLIGHVTRKVIKQTVMTSVYGVTMIGARDQIFNRLRELPDIKWKSDNSLSEINAAAMYLAKTTLHALENLFSGARAIMAWLADVAKLVCEAGQPVEWITPLGLPVVQPYRQSRQFTVRTAQQSVVLADHNDLLPVSKMRQRSAFPPNFVHSLDATHMFMTALECSEKGLSFASVHDSFWTHAGSVEVMNTALRKQFVELYSQPILTELRDVYQLRYPDIEFPPVPTKLTTDGDGDDILDLQLVKDSKYFFA